ncbi:hypothetical protein ACTI_12630 [Actinoplanes sp. OR16]|uniref:hypothetical protein n=1 Tax=Actinoplanes sp. OR16 TaxID=946334 RepID=UPI000F6E64CF|nr:hypothetical protein [Actinoplanes sp. OR16]BBH64578.1 hypothetical protein ACTI_12630 [Actinoplanes sp. OR16]
MSAVHRGLPKLYPGDFRREYEEEMLAVLAAEGRPGPAQVFDLVRAALLVRLSRLPVPSGLRRAAAVTQLFGAVLLLAMALRRVVPFVPERLAAVDPLDLLRVAGWAAVVLAASRGWRLLGLVGAAAGMAGEIAAPSRFYLDTPAMVLNAYWIIMTAAVVLAAGLIAARHRGGTRGLIPVVAAGGVLVSLGAVSAVEPIALSQALVLGRVGWVTFSGALVLLLAAGALVLLAVVRQEPVVRRWLAAWAAPVLVTVPLVRSGFDAFMEFNSYHPEATRLIGGFQWAALVLVPVAAFLVVAVLTSRFERAA